MTNKRFEYGMVVCEQKVAEKMKQNKSFNSFVRTSLGRYSAADWGDIPEKVSMTNDESVKNGGHIEAIYLHKDSNLKIGIITGSDRTRTFILLLEDDEHDN